MELKSAITIILKELEEGREIFSDLKSLSSAQTIRLEVAKAKYRSAEEMLKVLLKLNLDGSKLLPFEENLDSDKGISDKNLDIENLHNPSELLDRKNSNESNTSKSTKAEKLDIVDGFDLDDTKKTADSKADSKVEERGAKKDNKNQILADRFSQQASLNEISAGKRSDGDSADLQKLKPIQHLGDAIGINEKYLFVRELFNGDQDLYRISIAQLDDSENIDDAKSMIEKSASEFKGTEAYDKLLELVKRKLASK